MINKTSPVRKEIQSIKPDYLEVKVIPVVGDTLWIGCRREYVVEDVPANLSHGHLIRTLYNDQGHKVESTYLIGITEPSSTLRLLGTAKGPDI
jgi:hypothetical protein